MRGALALLTALLLLAFPAASQEELHNAWKSSLEALRSMIGEEALREIERARDLREAVLAQIRVLGEHREKLESAVMPAAEGEGFEEELQRELSSVVGRLEELGILAQEASAQAKGFSAEEWMELVARAREVWSLRLALLELAKRTQRGAAESSEKIEELTERIASAFNLSRAWRACVIETLPISPEPERSPLPDPTACIKPQPIPLPLPEPDKDGNVSLKLLITQRGDMRLEPPQVELAVKGDMDGTALFKDVAKLHSSGGSIVIKAFASVKGQVIGGITVYLKGDNGKTYRIDMPCSFATAICVRIMMIIPGYDAPMSIEPGVYSVDVQISWNAESAVSGTIQVVLIGADGRG
ncbi:MAG: hypothetical protein N3F67_03355 [Acidilobaceae archaeon]|nr:hypothetical protein [Acidilobaceae archaeon]